MIRGAFYFVRWPSAERRRSRSSSPAEEPRRERTPVLMRLVLRWSAAGFDFGSGGFRRLRPRRCGLLLSLRGASAVLQPAFAARVSPQASAFAAGGATRCGKRSGGGGSKPPRRVVASHQPKRSGRTAKASEPEAARPKRRWRQIRRRGRLHALIALLRLRGCTPADRPAAERAAPTSPEPAGRTVPGQHRRRTRRVHDGVVIAVDGPADRRRTRTVDAGRR